MTRRNTVIAFILGIAVVIQLLHAQDAAPPKPTADQVRAAQQAEARRVAAEKAQRARDEAERKKRFTDIVGTVSPLEAQRNSIPRLNSEPCLAQAMPPDPKVDLKNIPVMEWLSREAAIQIPWKVQIDSPKMRMDQRFEIAYSATIRSKDLGQHSGNAYQVVFVSGVSDADGRWLTAPKTGTQTIETPVEFNLRFPGCVFVQPGEYVLWLAIYDQQTMKHSVVKRSIRIPAISNDPLPGLGSRLAIAEFPEIHGPDRNLPQAIPGKLTLPVSNKRPIRMELMPIVSPPEQWTGRTDIVRSHNSDVLAATSVLSQMELASGSISVTGLDLVKQEVGFEQKNFQQLNWTGLADSFTKIAKSYNVTLRELQNLRNHGLFFRESLRRLLDEPGNPERVVIVISSSLMFEDGSDLQPLKLEDDCRCRVYHLRFRFSNNDVFDDLQKLIKPLRPKTFNVMSPLDLRKAVAEIVHELEEQP